MFESIPPDLTGLWRRELMIWPDGSRDTDTVVFWLQTRSLYADIRVPAKRPARPAGESFESCSDEDLLGFAEVYGFAGRLTVEGNLCKWARAMDYHPPGGPPDEAHYVFDGELLIETGIHANYREDWAKQTPADAPLTAFTREDGPGIFVMAGEHFLLAEGRDEALPVADSLPALIASDMAEGARDRAIGRLNMRIAYGRNGVVELSTQPWTEGKPLFGAAATRFHPGSGLLQVDAPVAGQIWRLADTDLPPDHLARLFARSLS
jgi:hypothetical protein